jgi:GntR family transcriptional regulator/MocR family aminotransferase
VKIFKLSEVNNNQAKYLQLAETVRTAIRIGQLLAGEPLPSVKTLSDELSINRHTVMKSFAELIAEGWIESQQRIGYRVAQHIPIEQTRGVKLAKSDNGDSFNYRFVRSGSQLPENPAHSYRYNFSGGQPDVSAFPFAEFKRHMSDVLTRPNVKQLGYGEGAGTPELIEQVKAYLRKSRAIIDREIIITNGSQEAMFILAQLLLQAGDKVAVEALGYPPAMAAFQSAGAELVAIKQDKQGISPEHLEKIILQGNIRLIYLTPLHQYPTAVTLSVGRRMKIYQLAAKHLIPIIEDDYDHEFHYRCQPLAPMASQDPAQLVIYLSSFSKIMFPGARIGLMAVHPTLAKAVEEFRLMICHKSNVLMQSALAKWMKQGGFERHLRRTTRLNQQRRDHAVSVLRKSDLFEFEVPDGGMAIWLKIKNPKVSSSRLARDAHSLDIYIQHEGQYHLLKNDNQDSYFRIGFAGMDEDAFTNGMTLLVGLIEKQLSERPS